jgi:hypothetical protein
MAGLIGAAEKTLRVKEFRTSGTFTVPAGVKTVSLFLVGGGAGAGAGFCGQGGNVVSVNYDVSEKVSCAVLIGAGGAATSPGGTTSFDGVVNAAGGASNGVVISGAVSPTIGTSGQSGFGGHGANGVYAVASNGAYSGGVAPANTGAGGGTTSAGGSGYARMEWYE